jgi:SNF2 family DNA or RNA helicase
VFSELDFFEYQPSAIEKLKDHPAYGLLVDMGLGKTVIVLTAHNDRRRKNKRSPDSAILVIGPLRVCETVWEQEAREWNHLRHLKFVRILGGAKQRKRALYEKGDVYRWRIVPDAAGRTSVALRLARGR